MSSIIKFGSLISICVVLAAYFYKKQSDEMLKQHLKGVLSGLLRAEKKVLPEGKKVAVGFGSCLDVISSGVDVLKKIGAEPPQLPEHFHEINSVDELQKVFAYFFKHGAAAERYVKNEELFAKLVAIAKELDASYTALGGNAPVMANRFQREGCDVLLGTKITNNLQKKILSGIKVVGGQLEEDDIHLLLEYANGAVWGNYTSPRANRFIVHNDDNNPLLSSLEAFSLELKQFSPTLLVVGGLQMMDNFPFGQGDREQRLLKLRDVLAAIPTETRIHFEMASFAEEACLKDVINNVVYYSDSLGMNEQELPNLHGILTNGSVTLISDPYPRIATTLDHMRTVYKLLQDTDTKDGKRKISRLHIHTLAFQAIMTTKKSSWKNSMSAAAKASLVANRHTCGSNFIHLEKTKMLMDESFTTSREGEAQKIEFQPERPVACWEELEVEICVAPVLVCTEVVQTGGGGDNVSSAGLVLQI